MNKCPYCFYNLLPHLCSKNLYWYCSHCRLNLDGAMPTTEATATQPAIKSDYSNSKISNHL